MPETRPSGSDRQSWCLNGIDAKTGAYLVAPLGVPDVARLARGEAVPTADRPSGLVADPPDPAVTRWLKGLWRRLTQPSLGLPFGVDPASVAQAGWAIVFHDQERDEVKRALEPLIEHRRGLAGAGRCHVLTYSTGQSWTGWLAAHGVGAGNVVPEKVPYYLLLVGGPERLPFPLCHQLDVEYAVGCLHFDSPAEYAQYAQSVVAYETAATVPNGPTACFFATEHEGDQATALSARQLVAPLSSAPVGGFEVQTRLAGHATKAALLEALCSGATHKPPALLFTATHGMGWRDPDARQFAEQGALICQDWQPFAPPAPADYLAAADVPDEASCHGLVAFLFACYGAGTPGHDRFVHEKGVPPRPIAERPFLAALPRRLLAHPGGGALAVIGHVERAWGYSIGTPGAGAQLLPFRNTLDRLAAGQPVGHAVHDFNLRYAALAAHLSGLLEQAGWGASVDELELARAWVEHNDAQGYLVLGDPAARLRVDAMTS